MDHLRKTLESAVAKFGEQATAKLAGSGQPEASLRAPLEWMLTQVGEALKTDLAMHDEDQLSDIGARPDWSIHCDGVLVGHLELKAPGKGVDTSTYSGHDATQWKKLKSLPNVLYTDGNQWAIYRYGERAGEIAYVHGDVRTSGSELSVVGDELAIVLADFLSWTPIPPSSPKQLATTTAQLCRLLRTEIAEALISSDTMRGVADEWRSLLFPDATDEEFADGYAQTVTFALLLARSEGIDFAGDVGSIASKLGSTHSLIGKALAVLTDQSLFANLATSLTTLLRVVGVVDWSKLRAVGTGESDEQPEDVSEWLYFYEHFLSVYDPELRKQTGSYYTPNEVVEFMVDMTDDLIRSRLKRKRGLGTRTATILDPAVGTGAFLLQIIERIAEQAKNEEGAGAVAAILRELPKRLIGFERQIGPFAVAQLRVHELLKAEIELSLGGQTSMDVPLDDSRLYVADTLDDPYVEDAQLGKMYDAISKSRREANKVKTDEEVFVVIGNPPYKDKAGGKGGWVENGNGDGNLPLMDDFTPPTEWGVGAHTKHLKNLNTYFWRWAIWKVFEAHEASTAGVVAFITTKAFLDGDGFDAMRSHMRSVVEAIYVVDVSPEGHQPPVNTRLFPGVQQPLAITFLVRNDERQPDKPALVRYASVTGKQAEKYASLKKLKFRSKGVWRDCPTEWRASFLPTDVGWLAMPTISDLLPWNVSGIMAGRTWVYAPRTEDLIARWSKLTSVPIDGTEAEKAANAATRRALFREHKNDRPITKSLATNLPGYPANPTPIGREVGPCPSPVRVSYRTLDRQWIIPDKRVLNRPNPSLWATHSGAQVYLTTKSDGATKTGPPLTFAAELPDLHHHRNRGGRAHPLWRDQSASSPNIAPGLCEQLSDTLGVDVSPEDVLAYIAGVASHSGYTTRYKDVMGMGTTEPRIPITRDPQLWQDAIHTGSEIVWIQTYAARYVNEAAGRESATFLLPIATRPKVTKGIPFTAEGMPDQVSWEPDEGDDDIGTLFVGTGEVYPVTRAAWEHSIEDYYLIRRWFGYRAKNPGGKRDSQLDLIVATEWPAGWTTELLALINAIERLVALGVHQADLLAKIVDPAGAGTISVDDLTTAGVLPVAKEVASPLLPAVSDTLFVAEQTALRESGD